MSGIYISGLDIPAQGSVTLHLCASGAVETSNGRLQAVPIPDHGRLGDLDALMASGFTLRHMRVERAPDGRYSIWSEAVPLDDEEVAPTVIPADQEAPA